jgi:hypothetical protein
MCPSTPPMTGRKKSDIILGYEGESVERRRRRRIWRQRWTRIACKKTDKPIHPKHPLTSYKIKLTLWTIVLISFPSFPFHHSFHSLIPPSPAFVELFQMVISIGVFLRLQPHLPGYRSCPMSYLLERGGLLENRYVVMSGVGVMKGW